ncbi:MAG TPA: hypothetical protein VJV79_35850 [Polyangiaceae bacterium]|nr:hypothetical protein [Polyangiaceae bacterium]
MHTFGEWLERLRASSDDEDRATLAFFELNRSNGEVKAPGSSAPLSFSAVRARIPELNTSPISDSLIAAYCRSAIELGLVCAPAQSTDETAHLRANPSSAKVSS